MWPWGGGKLRLRQRETMTFMPQRPYLPLGTLRAAVCYPAEPGRFDEAAVVAALERVDLGHLVPSLDRTERWDQQLPMDEQQRLAFARLLPHAPRWVVLDDAVSALSDLHLRRVLSLSDREMVGATLIRLGRDPSWTASGVERCTSSSVRAGPPCAPTCRPGPGRCMLCRPVRARAWPLAAAWRVAWQGRTLGDVKERSEVTNAAQDQNKPRQDARSHPSGKGPPTAAGALIATTVPVGGNAARRPAFGSPKFAAGTLRPWRRQRAIRPCLVIYLVSRSPHSGRSSPAPRLPCAAGRWPPWPSVRWRLRWSPTRSPRRSLWHRRRPGRPD